ncbi:MAG: AAA family ATPase, partial [Hyphomonadaceae bacterium]|nr:AAA family ATPase [Hyphomonadaceae bacterium]
VLSRLSVYRKGSTYVINIGFTSEDPVKAASLANAFAENYLLEQLDAKFDATSRANSWLNDRLTVLRAEVRSAENAVEVYRGQSGLLSAQGSSLTEQQISDLNAQLIIQTADYNETVARLESVKAKVARGDAADTIGEVLASAVIQTLRAQESTVAGKRAELSSRYGPRHPEVLKVEREAADVQAQIQQEIKRIVSNLESEVGIAQQKVRSIESGLNRLRGELSSNNRSLVRLRELERDAEASRSLYESFLERFKENDDQETITDADARIISKAVIPSTQSSPNTLLNILLGLALGVAAGLGMVVLAEMLDNGLSTGADVEREIGVPFIASVPKLGDGWVNVVRNLMGKTQMPGDFIAENPLSMFAESFRTLRSTILLSDSDKKPKVVTISSALPGEGKTTIVRSLGRLSAMSGSKTVIVDCDLRLRQLSKLSEVAPKAGLIKYLKGDAALRDLIVKDKKSECDYILNSENEYTNRDLFGTPEFGKLLTALRRKYDLVILDTAPILLVTETREIARQSDAVVIASRWRKTKADAVTTATNILQSVNANIIGLVLTQVNMRTRRKYGIGDYSYYSRQYGKYYASPIKETVG